jgi:peptide deformylase
MIYPIVAYGDPVLKKVAQDIEEGSLDVAKVSADMFETMENAHGVGLAAPQVGLNIRLFIIDTSVFDDKEITPVRKVFVNPIIEEEWGEEWEYEEGCLSIPGVRANVYRPANLRISYFDTDWKEHVEEFDGMTARVIQHEYDHIEGVLFVDHLSSIKKRLLKGKLTNISKGECDASYRMKFPIKK